MARILITEPYEEVRELLVHVVTRLGHEPVVYRGGAQSSPDTLDVDVVLLEPALEGGVELAAALRRAREGLPIVCVSILPPSEETAALDPIDYLVKPFSLADFQRALETAIGIGELRSLCG